MINKIIWQGYVATTLQWDKVKHQELCKVEVKSDKIKLILRLIILLGFII